MTPESERETAERYREGLRSWLASQMPRAEAIEVGVVDPISSVGNARRPWVFDVGWREDEGARSMRCVMLVKVPGGQLESELAPEYATLRVLHAHGVTIPRPLWIDTDGSAFGEPFFVTEWVPGTASLELLKRPLGDPQSRAVAEGMADVAAAAHTVDWDAAGVDLPRVSPESAALVQLGEWEERFVRQRLEPLPAVVYAFDWLRDNAPVADRVSIVHGDFRFGNVLYDGPRVTAMLDWELVHLGDPLEDLAWAYRTRWGLDRFMPLEEFLVRYTSKSGIAVEAGHFRWHRMFAEVKHTVISISAARSFNDRRTTWLRHADRASMATPFMSRFYDMLDAPVASAVASRDVPVP